MNRQRGPVVYDGPTPSMSWKYGFWGNRRFKYLDTQAPGAWPNGSIVEKCAMDAIGSDTVDLGARGRVIGSMGPVEHPTLSRGEEYGYFVEYDDRPGLYILTFGHKLALAT